MFEVQILMDDKVLASGVRTDSIEVAQPSKLGSGDCGGLHLQRPDHRCRLAFPRKLITALYELGRGSVCRRNANRVGAQTQCLAKLVPERDVGPLLFDVVCELIGVTAADLLKPNRDRSNYVRVLLDLVAEFIPSQGALCPTPVEPVVQKVPASRDVVEGQLHEILLCWTDC